MFQGYILLVLAFFFSFFLVFIGVTMLEFCFFDLFLCD
uniref:Uncharacterized protein n=1 Tax=Rhizophora mucronata TaxID=61149 RepID=A0A2P2N835_RHIMU